MPKLKESRLAANIEFNYIFNFKKGLIKDDPAVLYLLLINSRLHQHIKLGRFKIAKDGVNQDRCYYQLKDDDGAVYNIVLSHSVLVFNDMFYVIDHNKKFSGVNGTVTFASHQVLLDPKTKRAKLEACDPPMAFKLINGNAICSASSAQRSKEKAKRVIWFNKVVNQEVMAAKTYFHQVLGYDVSLIGKSFQNSITQEQTSTFWKNKPLKARYCMPFLPGLNGRDFNIASETIMNKLKFIICLLKHTGSVHDAGLVHRDLKPANILVDEQGDHYNITFCDWGLGGQRDQLSEPLATWIYAPREILANYIVRSQIKLPINPNQDTFAITVYICQILLGSLGCFPKEILTHWGRDLRSEIERIYSVSQQGYQFKSLTKHTIVDNEHVLIEDELHRLIEILQKQFCKKSEMRPDIKELLNVFTTVYESCLLRQAAVDSPGISNH